MTTPEELRILRHSLGLDQSKVSYRNFYYVLKDSPEHALCLRLSNKGLLDNGWALPGGHGYDFLYTATPAGIAAAQGIDAPKPTQCAWTEDEDGAWWSGCDIAHYIDFESPSKMGMRFCCYCGAELVEKMFMAEDEGATDEG